VIKSDFAALLERRLGVSVGRITQHANRLSDAGVISRIKGSRRFPPELSEHEAAAILLAAVANPPIGDVVSVVRILPDYGVAKPLIALLRGEAAVGTTGDVLIVRQEPLGAALVIDGVHRAYGPPAPETGAIRGAHVPGNTLAAVAAEYRGASPRDAEAVAAMARINTGHIM
jgi:hypothetical protein